MCAFNKLKNKSNKRIKGEVVFRKSGPTSRLFLCSLCWVKTRSVHGDGMCFEAGTASPVLSFRARTRRVGFLSDFWLVYGQLLLSCCHRKRE